MVNSAWFARKGFSTSLVSQYVTSGWLAQPARGVYCKPGRKLTWQQAVISLQTIILDDPIVVGGRTALELHGDSHYLKQKTAAVHLYSKEPLPRWLEALELRVQFVHRNSRKLFSNDPITFGLGSLQFDVKTSTGTGKDPFEHGVTSQPWGQWDWPLTLSTPERALLEMLDELPSHESFHQVDKLVEGLTTLSPRRLQKLLVDCRSVKVRRLFFFFADRHKHAWLKHLKKDRIDLGSGKRMLAKGGKLDRAYQITVPEDLDAA